MVLAPVPDFRYVGLEPIPARKLGLAATALGLGAGMTMAMSGFGARHAVVAGALATVGSAFAMRGARRATPASGSARMGIVPWGVLVDTDESPRILRWPGIRRVDVITRARHVLGGATLSSRVVVETDRDQFVGEAMGAVPLERLVVHLDAYADEQSNRLALDLEGGQRAGALEAHEPCCEALLGAARSWLETAAAVAELDLPPAGYRRTAVHAASARAVEVLRRVLRDRTPKSADPRAFAAIVCAELCAVELAPELVALTQCPHPVVAAFAKQAGRKLGVARAKTGTLDEVAPFLHEPDRALLDGWARA